MMSQTLGGPSFVAVTGQAVADYIAREQCCYTIVQSTKFFEFVGGIAQSGTSADGKTVSLSPAQIQPISSDDIALAMADFATASPLNSTVEVAGAERMRLYELVRGCLASRKDAGAVVADSHARYFGAALADDTLLPTWRRALGNDPFR